MTSVTLNLDNAEHAQAWAQALAMAKATRPKKNHTQLII